MKIKSLRIQNYRSIKDVPFDVSSFEGNKTFALLGINEAGKTSMLKAIALKEGFFPVSIKDFNEPTLPIKVSFIYSLGEDETEEIRKGLVDAKAGNELIEEVQVPEVTLNTIYEPGDPTAKKHSLEVSVDQEETKTHIQDNFLNYVLEHAPKVIFWTSEPRYLITEPVNLTEFIADPDGKSIPLKNCFILAGVTDIPAEINKINSDTAGSHNLQKKMADKVTAHIKSVWPNHPVKISFIINNDQISFLIDDDNVEYQSKTLDQRSDGFKQFISFLLTISAQNVNNQLNNSVIVLDEPETHLHPKGQEYLRDELIKISKEESNNVVIYATHSNYMVDKDTLNRNYKVEKEANKETHISPFNEKQTTYSEVNYEVFNIPSSDYHNELYGFLEDNDKLGSLDKNKTWKNEKTKKDDTVSLATYIRHSIHHPENKTNKTFTQAELVESIEILRKIKYDHE